MNIQLNIHLLITYEIFANYFNVKNQIKLMFVTICSTLCTIPIQEDSNDFYDNLAKTYYSLCFFSFDHF